MSHIQRILCPVDFSEFSEKAYDYAQSLACHYNSALFLLHVIDSLAPYRCCYAFPEGYDEVLRGLSAGAERQLREFGESHSQHLVQPRYKVKDGTASDLILNFAEAQAINLIVMGTHGVRGFDRLVLGSVTDKVLRKSCCPVLAVRNPEHGLLTPGPDPDRIHIRRIVYCTDFSACSERALDHALSLAQEYKAELTLLHVLEDSVHADDLQTEIDEATKRLAQRLRLGNTGATKFIVRIGKPYQRIIELALESFADLIVMGVCGRNAVDLKLLGSTTERVVQLGPCPVLVVHS